MKPPEIKSCEFCDYFSEEMYETSCVWPHKLPMRNLRRNISFPHWCPLPDAPGSSDSLEIKLLTQHQKEGG